MPDVKPRVVAVAIPVQLTKGVASHASAQDLRICLVSSRKHAGKYVLPKGGVEHGESSRQAAVRELWEEAGLVTDETAHSSYLSSATEEQLSIDDHKPHKHSTGQDSTQHDFVPRATYVAHEIPISQDASQHDWPERDERSRKWVSVEQAHAEIAWRKDIAALFQIWASGLPKHTQA